MESNNMEEHTDEKCRTQSYSAVDEARAKRERIFRLRADKPLHIPRDPWKLSSEVWNCVGIWNWTVLILLLVAVKMFLENINKFGLQIDPSLWSITLLGTSNSLSALFPVLVLVLYINVPLAVALKTELYLAQNVIEWRTGLSIHIANLTVLLTMPVKQLDLLPGQVGLVTSLLLVTMYTCLFMKLLSYIQVNKWCRDSKLDDMEFAKRRRYSSRFSPSKVNSRNKSDLRKGFYKRSPTKELSDVFTGLSVRDTKGSNAILEAEMNNNESDCKNLEVSSTISNSYKDVINDKAMLDLNNNNSDFKSLEDTSKDLNDNELMSSNIKTSDRIQSPVNSLLKKSLFNLQAKKKLVDDFDELFDDSIKYDVVYPDNLTFRDIYYFWFVPTLCYQINFPRTRRIRTGFLFNRAVEVFVCTNICICIIQQYIIPSVAHTLLPFYKLEISLATERLLKMALPNHLLWLLSFYVLFHSFLNTSAEILHFADRSFFRDWWNAPNLEVFWKTWNLPVHRWCVRHIYKPMLSAGFSKSLSMISVFTVSALFHEYMIAVPLRMFKFGVCLGMLGQIPLVYVSRYVGIRFGTRFGNMMVWGSLILGQPLIIMIYYHDYVIQHYGHQIESMIETCQC